MANRDPEEYSEELLQACVESENPIEFFRSVARNGKVGFEEFRLIMQTPFRAFLQSVLNSAVERVPPGIPGFGQIQSLANQALRGFSMNSGLLLRQIFKFFDRDSDGKVSEAEIVESLTMLTRRDFRSLFNIIDLNGDGFVTESELMAVVRDVSEVVLDLADSLLDVFTDTIIFNSDLIKNSLTLVWMFLDSDGDGAITAADIGAQIPPQMAGMFEMGLAGLRMAGPSPLGGAFLDQIIQGEEDMRAKFAEALADSPDGHVSEARMYSLLLTNVRDTIREQLPAQLQVSLMASPIPNVQEVIEVITERVPTIVESKFPALFRAVFNMLDKDGDGRISQAEFDAFYSLTKCLKEDVEGSRIEILLESVLKIFDVNMDGKVTLDEADQVLKGILKVVREIIHVMLAIGKEAFVAILEADAIKKLIMEIGGGEEEGKFSLAKFQHFLAHSPLPRQIASLMHVEATPTPPVGAPDPFLRDGDNA